MKNVFLVAIIALFLISCNPNEDPVITKNEQTYQLYRATTAPINGHVTFTELGDGQVKIVIQLRNTRSGINHPAHLHFGSIAEVGELAFRLNPVDGNTGRSETILEQEYTDNDVLLSYGLIMEMNGSVKIHQNDTFFKHLVLAYGNIGKNENYLFEGAATCTGH